MKVKETDINKVMDKVEYHTYAVPKTNVVACWGHLPDGSSLGYGESICSIDGDYDVEIGRDKAMRKCVVVSRAKVHELLSFGLRLTGAVPDLLTIPNRSITPTQPVFNKREPRKVVAVDPMVVLAVHGAAALRDNLRVNPVERKLEGAAAMDPRNAVRPALRKRPK